MSLWTWFEERKHAQRTESDDAVAARRKALAALTAGAAGALVALAGGVVRAATARAPEPAPKPAGQEGHPHKWGMAIDLDKCTGCGGCVVACQQENNVPAFTPEQSEQSRGIFWMDMISNTEGAHSELGAQLLPVPCMQCDDPPCVKVCPVGATYLSAEGIVAQITDRCIGCRYCMSACPYSRRYFNWDEPQWSESEAQTLNPDVATRPSGVVEKCNFCHHRVRAAKEQAKADEKPLVDADVRHLTACAQTCPAQAITFGDLNDAHSEVSRLHASPRAVKLLEELGAKPKVVYLRETKWKE